MNKKIRAVVKHYEKNMKFESKFEQLSHKLDLIKDDTPLKSDVIVIRRKLIPAYMMSILVMALVTGLIGLQIGLGNLKVKTEYINPVEVELQKHVDIYMKSSILFHAIDNDNAVYVYYGLSEGQEILILNFNTEDSNGVIGVKYNDEVFQKDILTDGKWISVEIDSNASLIELQLSFIDINGNEVSSTLSFDIDPIQEFFYEFING